MPLKIREKTNRKEKQKIAQTVASLIEDGESIMLDSSSTSLMIAQELKKKKKLTVITNSVEVLIELSGCEGIQGHIHRRNLKGFFPVAGGQDGAGCAGEILCG